MAEFSRRRRAVRSRSPWMRGAWIAAALMLIAGCGGSRGLARYMATSGSSVVLVQAASSGRLQGTFTAHVAYAADPPHLRVSASSARFSGTIRGSIVTLDFHPR